MKRTIERFIYDSHWVVAPSDLWRFLQEIRHVLPIIVAMKEADLVLFALSLNVAESHWMWYVIIHIIFVLSAFGMGMLDKPTRHD